MGIYSGLFLILCYVLSAIFSYKNSSKIKNIWQYIVLYTLYYIIIAALVIVINGYEHNNCSLTDIEQKKMICLVIEFWLISLLCNTQLLKFFKISVSSILLILKFADVIYHYIFKEQGRLNADILEISGIIIYKAIMFFILRRNQKSIDCVDENVNIKN